MRISSPTNGPTKLQVNLEVGQLLVKICLTFDDRCLGIIFFKFYAPISTLGELKYASHFHTHIHTQKFDKKYIVSIIRVVRNSKKKKIQSSTWCGSFFGL